MTWHESHDNRIALARHLIEIGRLDVADEVLYFFEKPWKWTPDWEKFQAAKAGRETAGSAARGSCDRNCGTGIPHRTGDSAEIRSAPDDRKSEHEAPAHAAAETGC